MKTFLLTFFLLILTGLSQGADIPQGAINYYVNKYGHDKNDTLKIIPVDLRGDGSTQYLMTFAKGDWSGPESGWTVVVRENGQWGEPKTLGLRGEIANFSLMAFDPDKASFVHLPSYKHNGIITRWRKNWTFTYLENDVLTTVYFWAPSQIGLTDDALNTLMDSKKVRIVRKSVP
jgi:hypothetical protein